MHSAHPMPVIPAERSDDLHHYEHRKDSDLVLFMAGNQFMLADELVNTFRQQHPDVLRIFYETLPPGLELKQILAEGALYRDDTIDLIPDVYMSVSERAMQQLAEAGRIEPHGYRLYLHNRLSLMLPSGNPAGVRSIEDLGRTDVRISQPDPENEDIAFHIMDMYRDAGGDDLVRTIMEAKRQAGTTRMTVVHHRETPARIVGGEADAGPVWATEIRHARNTGLPVESLDPGPELDQRDKINYFICRLKKAPNPANADKFLAFMQTDAAREIYRRHGFIPHDVR